MDVYNRQRCITAEVVFYTHIHTHMWSRPRSTWTVKGIGIRKTTKIDKYIRKKINSDGCNSSFLVLEPEKSFLSTDKKHA